MGGGESEPFLAASVTYDEADAEAHAIELTSLYPPPCISFTEILLGAGAVILISFLGFKLRAEKKENATLLDRIADVDFNFGFKLGQAVFQLNQNHRREIEELDRQLAEMQQLLNRPRPVPKSLLRPYDPDEEDFAWYSAGSQSLMRSSYDHNEEA